MTDNVTKLWIIVYRSGGIWREAGLYSIKRNATADAKQLKEGKTYRGQIYHDVQIVQIEANS